MRTPHAGCQDPAWKEVRPSIHICESGLGSAQVSEREGETFLPSSKRPLGVMRMMSGADIG